MKKRIRTYVLILMTFVLFCGCGESAKDTAKEQEKEEVTKIPIVFLTDAATNERNNEELVNAFNEKYKGKYEADAEWLPYTSGEYRANLKYWNVTDELPAVITDVSFSQAFYQLMVNDKRLVNLEPYIKEDESWRESFEDGVLKACAENDDSLYMCPAASNCFSYAGIFYNKELLKKAGYDTFPTTWDEFFECCEALEQTGITPLGLHTGGTAWATMLFATAYLGASEEGQEFMRVRLPENYDEEPIRDMVKMLQKIYRYAGTKGVYQDFDVPYRQFMSEEVAMLPNGFWILWQFEGKWGEKIGFAPFPENVMIASPQSSSWGVVSSYPDEVKKGAVEFLKFRTEQTRRQADEFLNDTEREMTSLEKDYIQAVKKEITVIPNYQTMWNPILQNEVLMEELPKLLYHTIDEDTFIQKMNESAVKYKEEQ